MKINEFIEKYKNAKVQNTKVNPNAVSEYLQKELEIKSYVPFRDKRKIAEMIVAQNIAEKDGIKKYDSINAYIGLVVATISTHTNLEFSADPVADYDLLAESGLLPKIISEFQQDYNECDVILKMALAMELEDNNVNVLVGHFLDGILKRFESVSEVLNEKFKDFDLKDVLGADFNHEDLAKLSGLINKLK